MALIMITKQAISRELCHFKAQCFSWVRHVTTVAQNGQTKQWLFPDMFALCVELRWTEGCSVGCNQQPHQINPTHWALKLKVGLLALWWSARPPLWAEMWSPCSKSWVQFQVNWSWINPAGTGRFLLIKTPGRVDRSCANAWEVLQKSASSEGPLRTESRDPFYMTPSLLRLLHGRLIVMPELFLASGEKNLRAEEKCM